MKQKLSFSWIFIWVDFLERKEHSNILAETMIISSKKKLKSFKVMILAKRIETHRMNIKIVIF